MSGNENLQAEYFLVDFVNSIFSYYKKIVIPFQFFYMNTI